MHFGAKLREKQIHLKILRTFWILELCIRDCGSYINHITSYVVFNVVCLWNSICLWEKCFSNDQQNKLLQHNPFVIWGLTVLIKIIRATFWTVHKANINIFILLNVHCQQMTLLSYSLPKSQALIYFLSFIFCISLTPLFKKKKKLVCPRFSTDDIYSE